MHVAVSACLLGHNCKYNGGNNRDEHLLQLLDGHHIIPVCPEGASDLPCPRPPAEWQEGRVIDKEGKDVTDQFELGTQRTLARLEGKHIDLAVFQPRSPSCGVNTIYDGSFSGATVPGDGMLAAALKEQGIPCYAADDAGLDEVLGK